MYGVGIRIDLGEIEIRYTEHMLGLADIADAGVTVCLFHGADDYPITADDLNTIRAHREFFREAYASVGKHYE
jgi:hypothetical protein